MLPQVECERKKHAESARQTLTKLLDEVTQEHEREDGYFHIMGDSHRQEAAAAGLKAILDGTDTDQQVVEAFDYIAMMNSKNDGGHEVEAEAVALLTGWDINRLWHER